MKLEEEGRSVIDDPILLKDIVRVTYTGSDCAPSWIGQYLPVTHHPQYTRQAIWNAIHYRYYQTFVEDFMEPDRYVLDIGSGSGQRTAMLGRYSRTVTGIESDPIAYEFAQRHNTTFNVRHFLGKFPETSFWADYAFMVEIIEHVPDDKRDDMIAAALDTVRDRKGLVFLTTPADETARIPPHVGIWTRDLYPAIRERWKDHLVSEDRLHNSILEADIWADPRLPVGGSHHRWVLKP